MSHEVCAETVPAEHGLAPGKQHVELGSAQSELPTALRAARKRVQLLPLAPLALPPFHLFGKAGTTQKRLASGSEVIELLTAETDGSQAMLAGDLGKSGGHGFKNKSVENWFC